MSLEITTERIEDRTLVLTCDFHHSAEKVFRAWTEAEHMKEWLCPEEGATVVIHALDARVGGEIDFTMKMTEAEVRGTGRYKVVEPPRKLVYSWLWVGEGTSGVESQITVEIEPNPLGCSLKMVHERLYDAETRDSHIEGWTSCLHRLEKHLAS